MSAVGRRRIPVELSADRRFAERIKRLAAVSLVALGAIWWLATATLQAPPAVRAVLAAGWVLMPATLIASLAAPRLRYGLALPAGLVGGGLLAICAWWLPAAPVAAVGWLLITVGIAFGGLLGFWLWYRLLPVPPALDDPYSPARWAMIGVHVGLIVIGIGLAATALR